MSVSESDRDVRRTIQSRKAKQSCQGNKRERQRSGVWGRLDQLDERWVSEGVNGEGRWEGGGGGANDRRGRLEEQSERSSSTATKYLSTTLRRNGAHGRNAPKCVVKSAHARVCVCVLSTHLLPLPGGARLRGHVAVVAQGARGLQVTVERDVELFAVTRWGEASEWTSCRQRCEAREERGEREPCNDDSVYACENNVRQECVVRRGCETPRRNTSFYCRSALGLDECGTPAEPQNPVGWGQARAKGGRRLQPAQGHKSDESPTHPTPTTTTAAHTAL